MLKMNIEKIHHHEKLLKFRGFYMEWTPQNLASTEILFICFWDAPIGRFRPFSVGHPAFFLEPLNHWASWPLNRVIKPSIMHASHVLQTCDVLVAKNEHVFIELIDNRISSFYYVVYWDAYIVIIVRMSCVQNIHPIVQTYNKKTLLLCMCVQY